MSFQAPTMGELAVLIASYCNACVSAVHQPSRGDAASLNAHAKAVTIAARARGCGTDELFAAFESAWNRNTSWGLLPHTLQSAAYDRALTLLTELFLIES